MNNINIPACYFPSTVLFGCCDDILRDNMFPIKEKLILRFVDTAQEILRYVQRQHCELEELRQDCANTSTCIENNFPAHKLISQELVPLCAEIYHDKRFAEISVIILHDSMQHEECLSIFKNLAHHKSKKIYITNNLDAADVIEALEHGLIDRAIDSHTINLIADVAQCIDKFQRQYFTEISATTLRILNITAPWCLSDSIFISFFQKLCVEHGVVEYYIMDQMGSLLMLDQYAHIHLLLVNQSDVSAIKDLNLTQKPISHMINEKYKCSYFALKATNIKKLIHSYSEFLEVIDIEERLLS